MSSVCETSVPTTTGSASRGRPSRRATISAREGSPSRAGSVADISTPTAVPCQASLKRAGESGSAALRIACHETARKTIERHMIARPTSTQVGLDVTSEWPIRSMPMWSSAKYEAAAPPSAAAATAPRRRDPAGAPGAADAGTGSSDGSRCGGARGSRSAG